MNWLIDGLAWNKTLRHANCTSNATEKACYRLRSRLSIYDKAFLVGCARFELATNGLKVLFSIYLLLFKQVDRINTNQQLT